MFNVSGASLSPGAGGSGGGDKTRGHQPLAKDDKKSSPPKLVNEFDDDLMTEHIFCHPRKVALTKSVKSRAQNHGT